MTANASWPAGSVPTVCKYFLTSLIWAPNREEAGPAEMTLWNRAEGGSCLLQAGDIFVAESGYLVPKPSDLSQQPQTASSWLLSFEAPGQSSCCPVPHPSAR